jgi:hypothetical protein
MKIPVALTAAVLVWSAAGATAVAEPAHTCEQVEDELVEVDGLLDDWRGSRLTKLGGGKDLAAALRCAYDSSQLYLSLDIRDQRIVRTRAARARSEDHLVVRLGAGKKALSLQVFPGDGKVPGRIRVGGRKVPAWMQAAETLQKSGWSFELAVPLARIPGWSAARGEIAAGIEIHDADSSARQTIDEVLTWTGRLEQAGQAQVMRSFLKATGLSRADLRVDLLADLDGRGGPERVLVGGGYVGVLTDRFVYMTLPVQSGKDVRRVEVVDLGGDGRAAIIVEYRQYGNGGSRDVVGVWYVDGAGAFSRVLAFEVRKEAGGNVLASTWSLVPRGTHRKGKRSKRGRDLLVEAGEPVGWDEDSYEEARATDVQPILRPWEDRTSAVYWFEGGEAREGAPTRGR